MKIWQRTAVAMACTMLATVALADTSASLAGAQLGAGAGKVIEVSTETFGAGAAIPPKYSAYHDSVSPAVIWSPVSDAKSYLLLVEDPDAATPKPVVHWLVYDIPAGTTKLTEGQPSSPALVDPKGALQGKNSHGGDGWFGPRPPKGDAPHHYHVQVFALDRVLGLPAAAARDDVVNAAKGHVLARGELVGTYAEGK